MSWSDAMALAPFDDTSPFYGLTAPDDVRVRRQVLAEPSLDLAGKTWARLEDGTPLVTAEARGRGWIILVHTTADPAWSDLALSGVFVNMLRRVLALGQGKPGEATAALAPRASAPRPGRAAGRPQRSGAPSRRRRPAAWRPRRAAVVP